MTADEFAAALKRLGFSQASFARMLTDVGGVPLDPVTVWRWKSGDAAVPAPVAALVVILEDLPPRKIAALRRRGAPAKS